MEKWLDDLDKTEINEVLKYLQKRVNDSLDKDTADEVFGPDPFVGLSGRSLLDTVRLATKKCITNPSNLLQKSFGFFSDIKDVLLKESDLAPDKKDPRFLDTTWQENLFYRNWLKSYLGWKKQMARWVEDEKLSDEDKHRIMFVVDLFTDALSPSNCLLNPIAVKRFFETGGTSFAKGTQNFIKEMITNSGLPSQVDKTKFTVGKNLAMTPGSVIYRNEMLELIHYRPQAEKVFDRPILLIPPQINKYYILDLSEKKSVVKFMLSQGLQVFIVSWRNPTPKESHWGIGNYINALDKAVDVILEITGNKSLNAMAACTGGITALAMLGYYSAMDIDKMASLTLLVSMYDMSEKSAFSMFADDKMIDTARKRSAKKGVLKGSEMARIFSWMRPNNLIWNYWVNNYLLGEAPPAFDILFWNADTTELSAAFHSDILDLLQTNAFVQPGKVIINGQPIDLGKITSDVFSVAGTTDHICPWKGCYRSALNVGAKNNKNVFLLSQSGHMQCILNLPGNPKSAYYKNDAPHRNPKKWLETAESVRDSWWNNWTEWISERSGDLKSPPAEIGNKKYPPIMDAPGEYVKG